MIKLKEVVKKAIAGEKESFDTLIRSRSETIYKLAYFYTKNRDEALDILQDVIYKALISIKDLRLADISEILKIPLGTVKANLYRGLRKLKIKIEEGAEIE